MLNQIIDSLPVYLLVFIRCLVLIFTLPLFSMRSASRIAKVALAAYMAFFIYPTVNFNLYEPFLLEDGVSSLKFVLIAVGEGLIGVILGFFVSIIFAAFSAAGQFTATQMGFGAASAYDSLSQVENPLMGQFFNLVAMLVFMQTQWIQRLFLGGLVSSFKSLNAISLVQNRASVVKFLLSGLSSLFTDALVISLPVMGILLVISVCTGLLTKAAPQMNLLSEGFPVMILVAFILFMFMMRPMIYFFIRCFNKGFYKLDSLFAVIAGEI